MQNITLPNSQLNVSPFCLGCMQFSAIPDAANIHRLINTFRDAGGNFFDTAHCYCFWLPSGAGSSEILLGKYIRENNCRNQVVIATKGGHPSVPTYRTVENYLSPERISADIDDSLGRMQTDVIDLFWLHRDDPRLDVGAILDALHAEVRRGRIRYFGASNWTSQRIHEANTYARQHNLQGFIASQPRWSLLQYTAMTQEQRLKPGVLLHLNHEDRQWHTQSLLPAIPYGPTGNGFFASNGAGPEQHQTPANKVRGDRATQLARQKNATPNQIALAWLQAQPFPVIPILGTRDPDHLKDALGALTVTLTPAETAQLEKP